MYTNRVVTYPLGDHFIWLSGSLFEYRNLLWLKMCLLYELFYNTVGKMHKFTDEIHLVILKSYLTFSRHFFCTMYTCIMFICNNFFTHQVANT